MTGRMTVLAALAALVGTAGAVWFGMALRPVAVAAWLVPVPALLLAPRVSWRVAGAVPLVGMVLGYSHNWGFFARSHDEPLALGVGISFGFGVTLGLSALLFRQLVRGGRPVLAAVAAPAVWVGVLYLVSLNPRGIAGTLATSVGDLPVVLQTASVTGFLGVDFLVFFVGAALAALLAPGVRTSGRVRVGVVAGGLLVVALGAGAVRLSTTDGDGQRVALVSTNDNAWAPRLDEPAGQTMLASYVDELNRLPAGVRTAVLPEGALGVDDRTYPQLTTALRGVAGQRHLAVVIGVIHYVGDLRYGHALSFPADGGAPVTYLKWHDTVSPPGHDLVFPPLPAARTGIAICGDVTKSDPVDRYAAAGARTVLLPAATEDDNGWQFSRIALLRGVENGTSVGWAARGGTLLLADGRGRVLADAPTGGPGAFTTVISDVPSGPGATPYTRFGDWFEWLCLALVAGALVSSRFTKTGPARRT